jgi:5'-3' exonuclease
MIMKYDAILSENCEADDMIGIYANRFGYDNVVIVSVDKDFEQIPTTIFNPSKWEWKTVDIWTATKILYKQILTGDAADNIKGLLRVGPVKADKLLEGLTEEKDLYEAVVKAYDGDKGRVLENARLLWLRREEGQMWQPPE